MRQKILILATCFSALLTDALSFQSQSNKGEAPLVVRASLILKEPSCDKYCWYQVKVLKVLSGPKELRSFTRLRIGALSGDPGIPNQESTLYLERENPESRWKLIGGQAKLGVREAIPRIVNVMPESTVPGWLPSILQEQNATQAADKYFAEVDAGHFREAYSQLSQSQKKSVNLDQFIDMHGKFNQLAGKLKSRKITSISWANDPASAPYPGIYVSFDLTSQYENIDRYCGYIMLYQRLPTDPFEQTTELQAYIDNATVSKIEQQRSRDYVISKWKEISKGCPNYESIEFKLPGINRETKESNSAEWRFPTDKITKEQWQTYLDEVKAIPSVISTTAPNQLIFSVIADNSIYVFTTEDHPAYPAVVKRHVQMVDGHTVMIRHGHYAGDREAYDYWWHEFDALDVKIKEQLDKRAN